MKSPITTSSEKPNHQTAGVILLEAMSNGAFSVVQAFTPTVESTAPQSMSLEAFLAWDGATDRLYELIEGMPMPISDPTADHEDVADGICDLIKTYCLAQKLPYVAKRSKLVAVGSSDSKVTARRADIVVFEQLVWAGMKGLSSSAMAYTPPPLVIEVVSTNWRDDYLTKLAEYESIGVREYWIADYAGLGGIRYLGRPKRPMLSIYAMDAEGIEYGEPLQFREDEKIVSQVLTGLSITANQILGEIIG
jgi:Uma2 family endonuclease